jgi:hypothetical protein
MSSADKPLPFPKLKENYEYVIGPKADRLLIELETELRQKFGE